MSIKSVYIETFQNYVGGEGGEGGMGVSDAGTEKSL